MFRVLLILLLVYATPLGAQSADSASMLRSGSTVRLLLRDAPSQESVGAVLGRSGDTLRVITPELGLAEVALDDLAGLEVPASTARQTAIIAGASAAAGVVVGLVQGEGFVESVVLGSALAAVIVIPAGASERRRWRPVDPAAGWRDEPVGARVRVSAPELGFDRAELLLHDFRAGTLHLDDRGVLKASPIVQVTSLELSIGRDRRRGVRIGTAVGALAAITYGIARAVDEGAAVAIIPVTFVAFTVGGSIGGFTGFLLAPREWRRIPLPAPAPPRP
ncbi:MAG TPA: hypothetical protein VF584_26900 [Longimicrobium sp.]|jgi:hypothetical protein